MRRAGKGDAPFPWRLFLLGLLSAGLYGLGNYWQPALRWSSHPPYVPWILYVLWISLLFALYGVAITQVLRGQEAFHPWSIYMIVGWALLFRLSLLWILPGFLSDDLYRYLWDGLVQRAGINPYQYPPAAPGLAFLHDDVIFPMINRKEALTIYPPGAQLFFWGMAWGWPGSVIALKGAILVADACSVALLLLLLKHLDINRCHVLLYAWNPLVVVELALSGHLDGVMLPFLLGAVLLTLKQRSRPAGLLLGLATLIKLYPAVLLPVLYRKRTRQLLVVWAIMLVLGYLLYLGAGRQIIGFLPGYLAAGEEFNLGLRQMLLYLFGFVTDTPHRTVLWLTAFVLLLAAVQCLRSDRQTPQQVLGWAVGMIALYLLLVSPSVRQWYLVWLVALAAVMPTWSTPGWLYWSWSVYLDVLANLPGLDRYADWIHFAEYGPLFLWLGGYALWRRCRFASKTHPEPCPSGSAQHFASRIASAPAKLKDEG